MSPTLSPIEPDINFFMLEGIVGDATSMVDATNTIIESQFGVAAKNGAYFVDEEIAAQIFFLSGMASAMSRKVQRAYYAALDNAQRAKKCVSAEPAKVLRSIPVAPATSDLSGLDLAGLLALRDAIQTIDGVLDGLLCQPKFQSGPLSLNPAGKMLDELSGFLARYLSNVHDEAMRREPVGIGDQSLKMAFAFDRIADDFTSPEVVLDEVTSAIAKIRGGSSATHLRPKPATPSDSRA
jgi:hypothetical protein